MLPPDHDLVAVVLTASTDALPAAAHVVSDVQVGLTRDDLWLHRPLRRVTVR